MTKSLEKVWIGLDWGTHSSKWWYTAEEKPGKFFESTKTETVIDSTIHKTGRKLRLEREKSRVKSDCQDARLKRFLLNDPQGANYWEAAREGIEISLAEAASLSLAVLLGDVIASLAERNYSIVQGKTNVEIRFSLPNWISADATHQIARKRMFQTAAIVSLMIAEQDLNTIPCVAIEVGTEEWRKRIGEIRESTRCKNLFEQTPRDFRSMVETQFSIPDHASVSWRLAVESSAAGFPQLRHLLVPIEHAQKTQDHWVKLLVVDVGAGSTDAGYF